MTIRKAPRLLLLAMFMCGFAVRGQAIGADFLLYDATLASLPGDQPWLAYFGAGSVTQTLVAGGTRLATDSAARAGWSNTNPAPPFALKNASFPSLIASEGFAIDWTMRMIAESHSSADRAGTSIILLGANNKGIELGFWTDEIWVQTAPNFTKGESVNFNTQTASVDYRLLIFGDNYHLFANNTQILSGVTRSYAGSSIPPYTLSNYFFIGDNTTSAAATVELGSIKLVTSVPETHHSGLLIAVVLGAAALRKRSKAARSATLC